MSTPPGRFQAGTARVAAVLFILTAGLLGIEGCAPAGPPPGSEKRRSRQGKVRVEAYLFDARLWRNGKPTSFRLEVFDAGQVVGLSGRGYVGKSVLKGRLTPDSLLCYFPQSREYLAEAVADLLTRLPCGLRVSSLDLTALLKWTPPEVALPPAVEIAVLKEEPRRKWYRLRAEGCDWELTLRYDRRRPGWRLKRFDYIDGDRIRLRLVRREYKSRAQVRPERLRVLPPPDAVQVTP